MQEIIQHPKQMIFKLWKLCYCRSFSRIYVTEYFKSFIMVVYCSRHVLCATRFGTRLAVVHHVHCWSRRGGWWARRQLSCFCRRYAVEWALSLRWYACCCRKTWILCHWMSAHRLKQNTEKKKLLWLGSKYSLSKLDDRGPAIKLGSDTTEPSGHVRVLGVIMSSDLSLEKHVPAISATCFFHRQSLDVESAKILVQAELSLIFSNVSWRHTFLQNIDDKMY